MLLTLLVKEDLFYTRIWSLPLRTRTELAIEHCWLVVHGTCVLNSPWQHIPTWEDVKLDWKSR